MMAHSCSVCGKDITEDTRRGRCSDCSGRPGARADTQGGEIDVTMEVPVHAVGSSDGSPPRAGAAPCGQSASSVDQPTLGAAESAAGVPLPLDKVGYFGDYELLEEIARGGMGVVYKARQRSLNRIVALKMILAGRLASEQDVQRFHTEAEAAAGLDHPGIVPIYEVGEYQGQHFFSMGYVDGRSLADRIAEGPLPAREAAELVRSLAESMDHAHRQGVIHRDLKPANILLDRANQPRITDFGLAKKLKTDSALTGTGQILGTPSYMSPEQASGETDQLGPATDVYALGAILYAALTGRPPFQAANPMDVLIQVRHKDAVSPRQLDAGIPRDLETISLKCLEKSPDRRYASAEELRDELQRYLDDQPIQARPISSVARIARWCRRRPVIAAVTGLLMVTVFVGGALVTWQWRRAEAARRRAEVALGVAEIEKQTAEQARRETQVLSANLAADRAVRLCQDGDVANGVLWFARGLRVLPPESDLDHLFRANLDAWSSAMHRLRHLLDHEANVWTVAANLDGSNIATFAGDGTCQLWDANSGAPRGSRHQLSADVSAAAFSPDGRLLVTVTRSGEARVWELYNLAEPATSFQVDEDVTRIAVSLKGRLLTVTTGGRLRLWNLNAQGASVGQVIEVGKIVTAASFHPTKDTFATAATKDRGRFWDAYQLQFWDANTGETQGDPIAVKEVASIAFSPDGKRFATGHMGENCARIWDTETRTPLPIGAPAAHNAFQHKSWVVHVAFSPDGRQLVTGSRDGTARVWDVETGQGVGSSLQHRTAVQYATFLNSGRTLATISEDYSARVWRLGENPRPARSIRQPGSVRAVALSPDGETVIAGGDQRQVDHWSTTTGQRVGPTIRHATGVRDVAFCPTGKLFLTSDWCEIQFWETDGHGRAGQPLLYPDNSIHRIAFCRDGKRLLIGLGRDDHQQCEAQLRSMDLPAASPWNLVHSARVNRVAVSPNDRLALTASEDGTGRVWDLITGRPVTPPLQHQNALHAAAFSPDGQAVLTGDWNGLAILWDANTGERLGPVLRHPSAVLGGTFTPNGQIVLTSGWDANLRLWDVASGKPIGPPLAHSGPVYDVDASQDGRMAATASSGLVALWNLPRPLPDAAEAVEVWAQLAANCELDAHGELHILDATRWRELSEELERLAATNLYDRYGDSTAVTVLDRFALARQAYAANPDRGIELLEALIQDFPERSEVLFYTASVLQREAARRIVELKHPEDGYPLFIKAGKYARILQKASQSDLSPQERHLVTQALFNEACAFGVANDPQKALDSFRDAVKAGYNNPSAAERDPDLASLRDLFEFREIIETLKAKSP